MRDVERVEKALSELDVNATSDQSKADPAAFLEFESHKHAANVLKTIGFTFAEDVPKFESDELATAINECLKEEGITVLNMTSTIPETSCAAYQALTVASLNASCLARKDENAAFLFMRTEMNTPSFLFGTHWGLVQVHGKEQTEKLMKRQTTPSAYIFFRDRQIGISSSICSVDVNQAAIIVAIEMTGNQNHLKKEEAEIEKSE